MNASRRWCAWDKPSSADAIKVHGLRERDLSAGRPMDEVPPDLLRFVGGRPSLDYYIDFDVRMLNKYVRRRTGTHLPNERIEISRLYYDREYGDAPPLTSYDLRFLTIAQDLGVPPRRQHDAFNDALMSAMMYLQLCDMRERGVRLPRARTPLAVAPPAGADPPQECYTADAPPPRRGCFLFVDGDGTPLPADRRQTCVWLSFPCSAR